MRTRRFLSVMVVMTFFLSFATSVISQTITLTQAVICRAVVNRTPEGVGNSFPADTERLFCFTRIEGALQATEITHNWYHRGVLKASVVLSVRGSSWRTWSSKNLLPQWTGEWMVEVLAADGTPLESVVFTVE